MEIAKEASSSEVEVAKKPLLDLSGTLTLADSLVLVKVSDVVDGVAVAAEAESSGATGGLRIIADSIVKDKKEVRASLFTMRERDM